MKTNLTLRGKIVIALVIFLTILFAQFLLLYVAVDHSMKSQVSIAAMLTIILIGIYLLFTKDQHIDN